jgi:hypothetical protein
MSVCAAENMCAPEHLGCRTLYFGVDCISVLKRRLCVIWR